MQNYYVSGTALGTENLQWKKMMKSLFSRDLDSIKNNDNKSTNI